MALIDTEKQRQITDILDQIDQGVDPSVLSNNLAALSGSFGDTQAGRLILAAMQQYAGENSSVIKTSAAQAQDTLAEEEKRKKRELLHDLIIELSQHDMLFLNRVQQIIHDTNIDIEISDRINVNNQEAIVNSNILVASLQKKAETAPPEEQQQIREITSAQQEYQQRAEEFGATLQDLKHKQSRLKRQAELYKRAAQQGDNSKFELQQSINELNAQIFASRHMLREQATYTIETGSILKEMVEEYAQDHSLNEHEAQAFQKFSDALDNIKDLMVKLNQNNLSLDEHMALIEEFEQHAAIIDEGFDTVTNALKEQTAENPQASILIEELAQVRKQYQSINESLTANKEYLAQIKQDLQKITIFKDELSYVEKNYDSRADFLDSVRGGGDDTLSSLWGWAKKHAGNLFNTHEADDHVQTQDGNFVFHDNESGVYYYYPGNNPDAEIHVVTDPVEIAEYGHQAYNRQNPKFFANETRLGAQFQGLADNFMGAATEDQDLEEALKKIEHARQQKQKELEEQQQTEAAAQPPTPSPQTQTTSTSFASSADPLTSNTPKLSQTFASNAAPDPAANNPDYTPAQPTEEHTQTSSLPQRTA
ncbi:MAG: hypothetical protein CL570_00225 [Alphaproteobacteria bacterium]|nr:hypothetical protein [Alphaproteobacteria bacterium]|tara:strand:- start:146 stop:1927 length:1782 start_codon:yes stop_codon:yes gene_type:complete